MPLKWGFSSAGKIAHDYLNAMGSINKGDHQIVAISDPVVERAKAPAEQFNILKVYGSALSVAQDPDVEIVHVGALNPLHCEIALMMMEHGKHVLCEKPMCMNAKQVQKLINCAKKNNVFLMENLWPRFFPSYHYIRKQIQDGKLGEITSIDFEFGKDIRDLERIMKKDMGGGVMLDLGVYVIQFCQMVFQQEPKSIKATGALNDDGVDVEVTAELTYGYDRKATLRMSATKSFENAAEIIGTKGTMTIPFFWTPLYLIDVDGTKKTFPPIPKARYDFIFGRCEGLCYGPDEIRKCIRSGEKECELVSLRESLIIARIGDEIRRQLGVKFPSDDE